MTTEDIEEKIFKVLFIVGIFLATVCLSAMTAMVVFEAYKEIFK